jgi:hypothetical protein
MRLIIRLDPNRLLQWHVRLKRLAARAAAMADRYFAFILSTSDTTAKVPA